MKEKNEGKGKKKGGGVKEEVLRHCVGSRRSADAADSLAAVVSPPCRKPHAGLLQTEFLHTLRLCV